MSKVRSKTNELGEKKSKHLIAFLLDQASPETFFKMIDNNEMPHVSKYILGKKQSNGTYSKSTISKNIVTGYPSTSANSHTSLLTGCYAGKNNFILGGYWNLKGKKPVYIDTTKIGINTINKLNNVWINPESKMIFEYFSDSASFHGLNRGAEFKLLTPKKILTQFLPLLIKFKRKDKPGEVSPISNPDLWTSMFEKHIEEYINRIIKQDHMPSVTFIVFLLTDETGHKFGFDSPEYRNAANVMDIFVQRNVEGFINKKGKKIKGLKELGYLDSIIWTIFTDHSARKVYMDKIIGINAIIEAELGLKLIEGKEITNNNKKNSLKKIKDDYSKINAFSVVNDELWHGWFSKNGETIDSFTKFYNEDFFRNLNPKGIVLKQNIGKSIDLIDYLVSKEHIQYVIIPESNDNGILGTKTNELKPSERIQMRIPRDYNIKIISSGGKGLIKRIEKNKIIFYSYSVLDGKDPLGYSKSGLEYNNEYSHLEWLEKTIKLEIPDVFHRLFGFFDCIYTPNISITSEKKFQYFSTYNPINKIYKNRQSHDGLYSVESIVPFTISGPGIVKGTILSTL